MTFVTYSNAVRISEDELCLKMPSEFVTEIAPDLLATLYDTAKVRAWLIHYIEINPDAVRVPRMTAVYRKNKVERSRSYEMTRSVAYEKEQKDT